MTDVRSAGPLAPVMRYWHVIAAVGTIIFSLGAAQAQISATNDRVHQLDVSGTQYGRDAGSDTRERLARIEQKADDDREILKSISGKVDRIADRVR